MRCGAAGEGHEEALGVAPWVSVAAPGAGQGGIPAAGRVGVPSQIRAPKRPWDFPQGPLEVPPSCPRRAPLGNPEGSWRATRRTQGPQVTPHHVELADRRTQPRLAALRTDPTHAGHPRPGQTTRRSSAFRPRSLRGAAKTTMKVSSACRWDRPCHEDPGIGVTRLGACDVANNAAGG
jgi:hypothetical protein